MRKTFILMAVSASFVFGGAAYAMDTELYTKLANETIQQANSGFVPNVAALLKTQEQLVKLGIEGSRDYISKNPEHAGLLGEVIENAPNMMKMSLDEIEAEWHSGKFLKEKGYDLDKLDHFSEVFSLMDSIIHPATSYIAFKEYKRTRKAEFLDRAAAELTEVVEHVAHIGNPNKGALTSTQ